MSGYSYKDHLQTLNGFAAKADSKDKLTALIQYACMFVAAGQPGNVQKIQASVTAARKIFRVLRPLEVLTPLLCSPGFTTKTPVIEAINKIKSVLMAVYFFADHMVWAHQIGLMSNKDAQARWQKTSLWGWALGSVCQTVAEAIGIANTTVAPRKDGETEEEYAKRVKDAKDAINGKLLVLVHGVVQAVLAASLLSVINLKPRTTGAIGVLASTINCYLLYPAYPKKAKTA